MALKRAKSTKPNTSFLPDDRCDFDVLLGRGSDVLLELQRLEDRPRLSASAFMRDALLLANCDLERLATIEAKLDSSQGNACRVFVRNMTRELRQRTYP